MNIPDSPDELLREYHKSTESDSVCHCKACKATRTVLSLEMNVAEIMILQRNLLQGTLEEMSDMTQFLVSNGDTLSSIALSHLAGQIAAVAASVNSCMSTIRIMNERSQD